MGQINLVLAGAGGAGLSTTTKGIEANTFADLPDAKKYNGQVVKVKFTTGLLLTKKYAGDYVSDGISWKRMISNDMIGAIGSKKVNKGAVKNGDMAIFNEEKDEFIFKRQNRIFTFSNTETDNLDDTGKIFYNTGEIKINDGKAILLDVRIPLRNDSGSWGGCWIETVIIVNGKKINIGNTGYDGGIMALVSIIGTHHNRTILDIPKVLKIKGDYTLQIQFIGKSYDGTTIVNGSHGIGYGGGILGDIGTNENEFSKLNYMTTIIEEMDSEIITHK